MSVDPVYFELTFTVKPLVPTRDVLVDELSALPFDTFLETEDGVKAYVDQSLFNASKLSAIDHFPYTSGIAESIEWTISEIQQENWNANWESDFKPIVVGDRVSVRASFHKRIEADYELVIEPKMSFGTGHHQTTYQMLDFLSRLDNLENKRILDMGCGTSILAILAALKGASCDAIDIDSWCIENSLENADRNKVSICAWQDDSCQKAEGYYDLILANINRNILLDQVSDYVTKMNASSELWVSGFYIEDLLLLTDAFSVHGLELIESTDLDRWVAAKFRLIND
jgi:ribosomal protein L11 methyltransferase